MRPVPNARERRSSNMAIAALTYILFYFSAVSASVVVLGIIEVATND